MATVRLGNGVEFDGETLYHPDNFSTSEPLPLVFITESVQSEQCSSLSAGVATGMVVLCDSAGGDLISKGSAVLQAGGAGMVLFNTEERGYTTLAYDHLLPTSLVSYNAGLEIKSYINSTDNPTVSLIFKGTTFGSVAPEMSFFSSRGPNKLSPGILKPDITGPGVNILAAWPFLPRNGTGVTPRNRSFNVISGTSMSTPHLSGVAALVKSAHPDWSPAAIKSAIITSAYLKASDKLPIKDEQHQDASIFAIGNGHVDPSKAIDPGLIYDIEASDYTGYLCGLGYSDADLTTIVGRSVSCADVQVVAEGDLNYPTILVALNSTDSKIITRTVTNVGRANSTFKAQIEEPKAVTVTVEPEILKFQEINEKKNFTVSVSKASGSLSGEWKAQLYWISDDHVVRSVISEVSNV
ncbi:putative cucumisin [Dioscorea sansibarensis]